MKNAPPPVANGQPDSETIDIADIVISLNGRDEGKRFIVIGKEEGFSLLADGKGRRIDKPKRKKDKHILLEDRADDRITAKLAGGEKVTNNEIRRFLAQYAAAQSGDSLEDKVSFK